MEVVVFLVVRQRTGRRVRVKQNADCCLFGHSSADEKAVRDNVPRDPDRAACIMGTSSVKRCWIDIVVVVVLVD